MRASSYTIVRWLRMTQIKDCTKNCQCADNLRRLMLKLPNNFITMKEIEDEITMEEDRYQICFKKVKDL